MHRKECTLVLIVSCCFNLFLIKKSKLTFDFKIIYVLLIKNKNKMENTTSEQISEWEHNLSGASIIVMCFFGVILNVVLVIVIRSRMKTRGDRPNTLVLNLALINLCLCILALPISGYAGLQHKYLLLLYSICFF